MGIILAMSNLHQPTWREVLVEMYHQVGALNYFVVGELPALLVLVTLVWWLHTGRTLTRAPFEEHGDMLVAITLVWTLFALLICVDNVQKGRIEYGYLLNVNCATLIAAAMLFGLNAWHEQNAHKGAKL